LPKLDLTIDTEYIANLVNVMWLQTCNSGVYYMGKTYVISAKWYFSYWYHWL